MMASTRARSRPNPRPSLYPTVREAWTTYRDSHMRRKGRSEGTVASYADHFERLLKNWLDEPLSKFGNEPGLLKQRHDQMTIDNGPYIANGAMRSFRATYNHRAQERPFVAGRKSGPGRRLESGKTP